jgi:uncharacterized protein YndB with AHSA1/START domain
VRTAQTSADRWRALLKECQLDTEVDELATFDDRWTLRYTRLYAAPVERVWAAVTTPEQLNIWFLPITRVERRLGGRASFTWGKPEHEPQVAEVTVFDPPHRIRYQFLGTDGTPGAAYLEFQIEPVEAGTRLAFIDHFDPQVVAEPPADPSSKDAALPGGPDTPWRPGFVAGFHLSMEHLRRFLAEERTPEQIQEESAHKVGIASGEISGSLTSGLREPWLRLVDVYFDYIARVCPPA